MMLGFLIHRDAYYKYFGTIIDEALRRGHEIICLHDYGQPRDGSKKYQFPNLRKIPRFRYGDIQAVSFNNDSELLKIVQNHDIKVLVTLHFLPQYISLYNTLKKRGVFWVALQYGGDTILRSEYLGIPDRYLFYSDAWLDLALHHLSTQGVLRQQDITRYRVELKRKVKNIGFTELDQINMIDQKE